MRIRHVGVPGRRVDLAARSRDDLWIPEVIDECGVVGVEQTRPTHQRECKHMRVVGLAHPLPGEARGVIIHYFVSH